MIGKVRESQDFNRKSKYFYKKIKASKRLKEKLTMGSPYLIETTESYFDSKNKKET